MEKCGNLNSVGEKKKVVVIQAPKVSERVALASDVVTSAGPNLDSWRLLVLLL